MERHSIDYDKWWNEHGRHDPGVTWWTETFMEREKLLRATLGETSPPESVVAFNWKDSRLRTPGGSALVFPPLPPLRPLWAAVSHGLTQPLRPSDVAEPSAPSAYGAEFASLTFDKSPWCPPLLRELMTYVRGDGARIRAGHRVPCAFFHQGGGPRGRLGMVDEHDPNAFGNIRWLLFWPLPWCPRTLTTRTGAFEVLAGTGITSSEWALARQTTSAHLLLLLYEYGIGQATDVLRDPVTTRVGWSSAWERISSLEPKVLGEELSRMGAFAA